MSYIKYNIFEKIDKKFKDTFEHPKNVCMTYTEHAKVSFNLSYIFLKGATQGVIHSFYPDSYITYAQDTIKEADILLNESGCKD